MVTVALGPHSRSHAGPTVRITQAIGTSSTSKDSASEPPIARVPPLAARRDPPALHVTPRGRRSPRLASNIRADQRGSPILSAAARVAPEHTIRAARCGRLHLRRGEERLRIVSRPLGAYAEGERQVDES